MSTLQAPGDRSLHEVLADDPRVMAAAWVAETFHIDPLTVLAADRERFRIYLACAEARRKVNNPEADVSNDAPANT